MGEAAVDLDQIRATRAALESDLGVLEDRVRDGFLRRRTGLAIAAGACSLVMVGTFLLGRRTAPRERVVYESEPPAGRKIAVAVASAVASGVAARLLSNIRLKDRAFL